MTYLTVLQVAERLAVSSKLIYSLIYKGDLPCVHVGAAVRIAERDLQDYLDHSRTKNKPRENQPGTKPSKFTGKNHFAR